MPPLRVGAPQNGKEETYNFFLMFVNIGSLYRPVVFSAVFCGGTLAGCAIWQYENMREAAK